MLIDTHAHVNFNAFEDNGDEVIKRSLDNNVWMINVGSQYSTSRRAVDYAKKYQQGVYAAVGLHPLHLENVKVDLLEEDGFESRKEEFDYQKYRELALISKVVAIGEVGLDYYHVKKDIIKLSIERLDKPSVEDTDKLISQIQSRQKEAFKKQLELASDINKPVIVHCRDAHNDTLEILKEAKGRMKNLRGVTHCFSGNLDEARQYIKLRFLISFTGLITFAKNWDEVIRNVDLDKIMIETDCPYMTPVPFRGKRNEPMYVEYVARKIAEIRGVSFEEVAEQTTQNAKMLFGIE